MKEGEGSDRRGAGRHRDWTKGSIVRNLLSLSWPIMVNHSMFGVIQAVDMVWVGKLGAVPMAGVGIAGIIVMLGLSAKMGLTMGARAMIARFVGAGDIEGATHVARQAFVISAVYGVVMMAISFFLAEPILSLFGLEADVVAEGAAYLRRFSLAWLPMSFWLMANSIMQASGDTVTPMKVALSLASLHVLLCPFLVFGWWIFPRMDVIGAATTSIVSQSAGTVLALWFLFSGRTRLRLTLSNFRLDFNIVWRMVKIGIPASITSVERSFASLVLMWFIVPFGTLAVAAHSLAQRVESLIFMPGMSMGMGAGVLVGQNLGARQPERAERSGWQAVGLVEGFMVVCAVAILLGAESIVRIFNIEPDLVALASIFMRIQAVGALAQGFSGVLQNSISGAGDTLVPMLVGLVITWLVQVPLAFFLPRYTDLGVYGVRWALVIGMFVGAVFYTIYFRMGRWKQKRV